MAPQSGSDLGEGGAGLYTPAWTLLNVCRPWEGESRWARWVSSVKVRLWGGAQLAVPETGETSASVLRSNLCGSSQSTLELLRYSQFT